MKILNKANQRNVILDKDHYTAIEIRNMIKAKNAFNIEDTGFELNYDEMCDYYDEMYDNQIMELDVRIPLRKGGELKVVLDPYGYYANVYKRDDFEAYVIL